MKSRIQLGNINVRGYAQKMADGTWQARCCVTEHLAAETFDHLLEGGTFTDEGEAVTTGVHLGIDWVNAKYPRD